MKASFKVDKKALSKVTREIEKEINRHIKTGECRMSKDAEILLKFIVDEAKKSNVTAISFNIKEVKNIPNISFGIGELLNELEICGRLSNHIMTLGGNVVVYLTTDGMEYFFEKEKTEMDNKNSMTFNISGGQVNVARDNATINAIQNNDANKIELDNIIKNIMDSLSYLKKEDVDGIVDVVDMAKEELSKPEPKSNRLRNCITLIAPMMSIANGIPTLAANLQRLQDFIIQYIQ